MQSVEDAVGVKKESPSDFISMHEWGLGKDCACSCDGRPASGFSSPKTKDDLKEEERDKDKDGRVGLLLTSLSHKTDHRTPTIPII